VLREDKKARLVQHQGLFGGKRWQFVAPKFEGIKRFKEEEILPLLEHQMKIAPGVQRRRKATLDVPRPVLLGGRWIIRSRCDGARSVSQ